MTYDPLDDVTGVGKTIINRNKYSGIPFAVGVVEDEVSVSDGEQKYVVQLVHLHETVKCEADSTRYVLRFGYYTRRTDGWLCFGSQYAPIVTPAEWRSLISAVSEKGWLNQ